MTPCPVVDCHERGTVKVTDRSRRAPEWLRLCPRHGAMFERGELERTADGLVEPGRPAPKPSRSAKASTPAEEAKPSRKRARRRKPGGRNKARRVTDPEILAQIPPAGATTLEITDGLGGLVGQSAIYQRLRRLADKDRKIRHEARGRVSRWFLVDGVVVEPLEASPPADQGSTDETGATGLAPTPEAPVQSAEGASVHPFPRRAAADPFEGRTPTRDELEALPWREVDPAELGIGTTRPLHPKLAHVSARILELEHREHAIRVELFELRQARAALQRVADLAAAGDVDQALALLDNPHPGAPDGHRH